MNEQSSRSISELMADHPVIDSAIYRAVREAVLTHAREGRPVATLQNGQVVWIQPEEVLSRLGNTLHPK